MSSGRYKVIGQPTALPGKCYLTGSAGADSGPYIDTGQSIRGYGAVVYSAQAVEEMYRELKAYQGIDISKDLTEEQALAKYNEGFTAGVEETRSIIMAEVEAAIYDDLDHILSNRRAGLDPFAAPVDESQNIPEDAGKSEGSESGTDGTSESATPAPSGKGRGRVSGSADDDSASILGGLEL